MKCNGRLHVLRELAPRGPYPARLQPPGFALGSVTSIDRLLQPSINSGHLHAPAVREHPSLQQHVHVSSFPRFHPGSSRVSLHLFLNHFGSFVLSGGSYSMSAPVSIGPNGVQCKVTTRRQSQRSSSGNVLRKKKIGCETKTEGTRRGREECKESH